MRNLNRRDFVKVAGLTSLGLGFSNLIPFPLARAEELTKLGLVCPLFTKFVFFGPLVVGIESGFFKQRGFDVKVVEAGGGGEAARVFSGSKDMDVLLGAPASTVKAILKGEKWRAVANYMMLRSTWIVLGESPMKTIQDLKGKKVGYIGPGSTSHLISVLVFEKAGILDDVNLVSMAGAPETWAALKGGLIDCAPLEDPFTAKFRLSGEARILFTSTDYVKDISVNFFVVKESFLQEKPDLIKKWLLTVEEAAKLFLDEKNKKRTAEYYAKGTGFPVEILLRTIEDTPKNLWNLRFTPELLKLTEEGMKRFKMIDEPVPWSKIIDQSCLPESYRIKLPS
jgi:NitT/TauT family transport system substrate-binding protein